MKKLLLIILFPLVLYSQNQTMGLFTYEDNAYDAYTLFTPNETTYLIDNCGRIINTWTSNYKSGNSVYLLDDGTLLRTARIQSTIFTGGGIGGRIEKFDWNNNLLWYYDFANNLYHQHHDIEPLPNGNILVLCWEYKSFNEAVLNGRNPNSMADNELWSTYILEVEPVGMNDINIVWEWRLWDHLVQDFDSTKLNYGVINQNIDLLNINFYKGNGKNDWLHCNSIDYNEDLDQIVIGSRALSEFYVIDHSTSTLEAASNSGGIYNKGGNFLYRWGNPQAYDMGTISDQRLFGQHDVRWINKEYKDGGKFLLFNNGKDRGYSSVEIVSPNIDSNNNYLTLNNNQFGPSNSSWIYTDSIPQNFYSSYISGAQRLENGNTLICDGAHGTFFEIDSLENIVWKYINPVVNIGPLTQGDTIPITSNGWGNPTFRCTKYPINFSGFIGKNLTPGSFIELNPLSSSCEMISNFKNITNNSYNNKEILIDFIGRKENNKKNPFISLQKNKIVKKININY